MILKLQYVMLLRLKLKFKYSCFRAYILEKPINTFDSTLENSILCMRLRSNKRNLYSKSNQKIISTITEIKEIKFYNTITTKQNKNCTFSNYHNKNSNEKNITKYKLTAKKVLKFCKL